MKMFFWNAEAAPGRRLWRQDAENGGSYGIRWDEGVPIVVLSCASSRTDGLPHKSYPVELEPFEARAIARMLLAAADECEASARLRRAAQ